jgi:putative sulfotransferase
LSDILAESPHVLSLSEFFVSLGARAFERDILDGVGLWEILSTPHPKTTLILRNGIHVPEVLCRADTETPPMLVTTLPHITDEPEELFERVRRFVLGLAKDTLANQYRKLFEWLSARFGNQVWVERSGGSLRYVENLQQLYPDARFVHIYRDGRECAISMSRHNAYRLTIIQMMIQELVGLDPFVTTIPPDRREQLGELAKMLPEQFKVEAFESFHIPIERFGVLWSTKIVKGINCLSRVSPDDLLNVRYEDILTEPEAQILRFMSFVLPSFDDMDFVWRMARMVQTDKKPKWVDLKVGERERLARACSVGQRLLECR